MYVGLVEVVEVVVGVVFVEIEWLNWIMSDYDFEFELFLFGLGVLYECFVLVSEEFVEVFVFGF